MTGDGASFNAASASTAADVRWKKLTGIFGQPFPASSRLTCSLWRWEMALGPRGLLAPDLSRVAWTGGGSSEGWLRGSEFAPSVLQAASPESELRKRAGTASCGIESVYACSRGCSQDRLRLVQPCPRALTLGSTRTPDALTTTHACAQRRHRCVGVETERASAQTTLHASLHIGGRSTRARKRRELCHVGRPPSRRALGPFCW